MDHSQNRPPSLQLQLPTPAADHSTAAARQRRPAAVKDTEAFVVDLQMPEVDAQVVGGEERLLVGVDADGVDVIHVGVAELPPRTRIHRQPHRRPPRHLPGHRRSVSGGRRVTSAPTAAPAGGAQTERQWRTEGHIGDTDGGSVETETEGPSVLGLLLGTGCGVENSAGSQHKEWINMTPK